MEDSGNTGSIINLIWAPFWTQIMLGVRVWGQTGMKDQGSHDLASEFGPQRAQTQLLFYSKVHTFATLALGNEYLVDSS